VDSFIPYARSRTTDDQWIMLIVDGHGSHTTLNMMEAAFACKILLFFLPPGTNLHLQPLDQGIFGPLQQAWIKHCEQCLSEGVTITYDNVVKEYMTIRNKIFVKENILSAFAQSGIRPLNPGIFSDQAFSPLKNMSIYTQLYSNFPSSSATPLINDGSFYQPPESTQRRGALSLLADAISLPSIVTSTSASPSGFTPVSFISSHPPSITEVLARKDRTTLTKEDLWRDNAALEEQTAMLKEQLNEKEQEISRLKLQLDQSHAQYALGQAKSDDGAKKLGKKSLKERQSKVRTNARCLTVPHMRESFDQEKLTQNEKVRQEEEKKRLKAAKENELNRRLAEAPTAQITRRFSTFNTRSDLLVLGTALQISDSTFTGLTTKNMRNVIAQYIRENAEELALDPRTSKLVNPNKKAKLNPTTSVGEHLSNAFVLNISPPSTNPESQGDPHLPALSK
jgi:hypothetical protein